MEVIAIMKKECFIMGGKRVLHYGREKSVLLWAGKSVLLWAGKESFTNIHHSCKPFQNPLLGHAKEFDGILKNRFALNKISFY